MKAPTIWSDKEQQDLEKLVSARSQGELCKALLAIEGCDPTTEAGVQASLLQWAHRVRDLWLRYPTLHPAEAMQKVLVEELDFRGDSDEYYHPQNSYLSRVCERRRGLPILLSCVWIAVGRIADIQVDGIGMPGHFLVRVDRHIPRFVDPFASGRMLSLEDCKAIFSRIYQDKLTWQAKFLEPLPDSMIVDRVLNNLLGAFRRLNDSASLYFVLRLLSSIHPTQANLVWHQGVLAEELGDLDTAEHTFREYLRRFPQGKYAAEASEKLEGREEGQGWLQ